MSIHYPTKGIVQLSGQKLYSTGNNSVNFYQILKNLVPLERKPLIFDTPYLKMLFLCSQSQFSSDFKKLGTLLIGEARALISPLPCRVRRVFNTGQHSRVNESCHILKGSILMNSFKQNKIWIQFFSFKHFRRPLFLLI